MTKIYQVPFFKENTMRCNPVWLKIVTCLALVTLASTACATSTPTLHGAVIDPPVPAAEIKMTDHNGQPFQMSALRGKVVLLYFGYVHCPEECPLTMAHFKQALSTLGDMSKDVQVVMVSTDPVGDTSQALKDFLGKFSPDFLGIPGSPDELAKAWKDYGVAVLDGGETHSSYTYVIDKKGDLRETFVPDSTVDDLTADLKILLAEK
jgi:protein SCO1